LFKFDPIKFILLTSLALLLLKRQERFEQALPGPKGESQGWLSYRSQSPERRNSTDQDIVKGVVD